MWSQVPLSLQVWSSAALGREADCDRSFLQEPKDALVEQRVWTTGPGDTLRDLSPGGKWRVGS